MLTTLPLNCVDRQWRASPSLTSPRSRRSSSLPSWSSSPGATLPPSPPPPLARVRTRRRRRRRCCPAAAATATAAPARCGGVRLLPCTLRDIFAKTRHTVSRCVVCGDLAHSRRVACRAHRYLRTDHRAQTLPRRARVGAHPPGGTSRFTRRLPRDSIKRAAGNIHTGYRDILAYRSCDRVVRGTALQVCKRSMKPPIPPLSTASQHLFQLPCVSPSVDDARSSASDAVRDGRDWAHWATRGKAKRPDEQGSSPVGPARLSRDPLDTFSR